MKKIKLIVTTIIACVSITAFATERERIPDPTVQIMTPPSGLPGAKLDENSIPTPSYNELNIQGVLINNNKNKVFMNGGFYKVGDVVADLWQVKSITRKKVVLLNTETKQTKNLNISGE